MNTGKREINRIKAPFPPDQRGVIRLPSLAKNIHLLVQAVSDDALDCRQIAEIVKQYPDITARLLLLVNSPWSSPSKPVSSIEEACIRLGTAIVKSVSIAIAIASSFNPGKCPIFSTERFWTTAMLVADGAGLLAKELCSGDDGRELQQTAQTAGLLHHLGLLWLADYLPDQTNRALDMAASDPAVSVNDALLQCTGTDYCLAGEWIGGQMHFPEIVTAAMKFHRKPDYQGTGREISLLVGAGAAMVSALHRQDDALPESARLAATGLGLSSQQAVFAKLSGKLDKTREMAKTLF